MSLRLHAADTPNNRKITIALAEMGMAYEVVPVDLGAGAQHAPAFRAISPAGKTPALVDAGAGGPGSGEPVTVFESGAILTYLAEKAGAFLPQRGPARYAALAWTFWQTSALGPTLGQAWHFAYRRKAATGDAAPYAFRRFTAEGARLFQVMESALAARANLAGEAFTIADMAVFPWVAGGRRLLGLSWDDFPGLARWHAATAARPAVHAGMRALRVAGG